MDKGVEKKELILSSSPHIQTIVCDDKNPTEYSITIVNTLSDSSKFIFLIREARKKVILTIQSQMPHAQCEIEIFIKSEKNTHHVLRVFQNHAESDTQSSCAIRGIVYDTSSIDYEGLITLQSGSLNAIAHQTSKFLIMSEFATVRSVPSLQVHHNQVQCGHATTISYIDPIVLWYGMQRGISVAIVEKLIEKNFFL